MKIVIGHSTDPWAEGAVQELVDQCEKQLEGQTPKAGVLFTCLEIEHNVLLAKLMDNWPDLELIGCTTDGELSSREAFQEDSSTLMLFASDTVSFKACVGRNLSQDITGSLKQGVEDIDKPVPLCIMLPESLTISGTSLVSELQGLLGEDTILVGGASADQWNFEQCHQFIGTEVLTDSVPFLCVMGDVEVSVGIASGWTPLGERGLVTRAEGMVVHEIDHKPALDFYRHYIGEAHLDNLQEYPLAVFPEEEDDVFFLRTVFSFDREEGWIQFAAMLPENSAVQLTEAGRNEVLSACESSIQSALERFSGKTPQGALLISCAVRKQVLGTRTHEEYEKFAHAISPDLPVAGFYSYGEIGPLPGNNKSRFHNETFITVLVGD